MSILNLPLGFIFVHVPKTGGTSMEGWDFVGGGGHQPLIYFERACKLSIKGIDYDKLFRWAFVRNPYDRFASAATAHYMGHGDQAQFNRRPYDLTREGFTLFVEDYQEELENIKDWDPALIHFHPQHAMLKNQAGEVDLTFTGRFERLAKDWGQLCSRFRRKDAARLEVQRRNSFRDYDSLYTQHTRDVIYKIYREDFELFNYPK